MTWSRLSPNDSQVSKMHSLFEFRFFERFLLSFKPAAAWTVLDFRMTHATI